MISSTPSPKSPGSQPPMHRWIGVVAALCLVAVGSGSTVWPGARQAASNGTPPTAPPSTPIPASRQAAKVAVLTVEGAIDRWTYHSLERRIKEATAAGAEAIVIELDTPGGDAFATLDICSLLKDRTVTPANTVAWIHPKAYSAGTIMALACREIVVAPNAKFGDAAPIQGSPLGIIQLLPAERAKVESPILQEVVDSARRFGYDENLVRSFVSVGAELWLLQNVNTGERIFVDRAEYTRVFGADPPDEIGTITPRFQGDAGAVMPQYRTPLDDLFRDPNAVIEPAPTQEQIDEEIERGQMLARSRDPLTEDDADDWQLIEQVIAGDQLLVVGVAEATDYGLSNAVIADDEELRAYFGAAPIAQGGVVRYHENWSEGLVRFLVNPWVRTVLIIVFLICLFIELAAPGMGVFGITALVALLILIGPPFLVGMAQVWELILIGLGIILIAVELFVIPGFGVPGIAGAIALLVGLVSTFVSSDVSTPTGQSQLGVGVAATLAGIFFGGIGIWFVSRQIHQLPLMNKLVLSAELKNEHSDSDTPVGRAGSEGLIAAMSPTSRPTDGRLATGDVGIAITDLRPAGRADFNGRVVDVKAVGGYVDRGSPIRVAKASRFVIEVEEHRA